MKMDESASTEATSSEFALRVALQTMTERCKTLQKRLNTIEDENIEFRNNQIINENKFYNDVDVIDTKQNDKLLLDELRKKINDLELQKIQLNDHISMVSNENRQLWSRLSELSKERIINLSTNNKGGLVKSSSISDKNKIIIDILGNGNDLNNSSGSVGNEKNLIRSKTFTQHAPNPNLRYKNIDINESSLEEITLHNNLNNDNFESNNANQNCIGFSYLNNDLVQDDINDDVILDTKNCIDGILDFKRQQLQQQKNLEKLFNEIKKRIALQECSKCTLIKMSKPETAEKSSETDDSLTDEIAIESQPNLSTDEIVHIDFVKEKILADENDKTCPMCGKVFGCLVTFDNFRDHVEEHFISAANDEHLEFVSHIVGDF